MVSNPAIPVFVSAREEDGMFRWSFSPCSFFALCKLGRWRWREAEHIPYAFITMICRIPENGDDPSGNNRISNDSRVIGQFAIQVPQNEGRISLNVF